VDYQGTGRRKTSVARVRLLPGQGQVIINGKPVEEYFPSPMVRANVALPLRLTHVADRYDAVVRVEGGGLSSQAGAIRHGIARALLDVDETFRPILKKAGLVESRRNGTWMFYSLSRKRRTDYDQVQLALLRNWLNDDRLIEADRTRLAKVLKIDPHELCKA